MELHQTQKEVARDNHVYRVVCCGRQWGKTTLAVEEIRACAYAKAGRRVAYFATTFDQARNIAWAILKDKTRSIWAKPPNESRLELFIKTQDGGMSEISLRGFENIETARGQQFDLLVIDEVAFMRNWDYAWQAILEPTLAFRHGTALFISTPQGFNFFYQMYLWGQESTGDWKSWRFTSYENPYLDKERIEKAKDKSTEDYFAQEYMADFRKYTGLVYKEFQREVHIIEPFEIPEGWQMYRGVDFGSTNPTACLWVAIDNDENWYVTSEHYATGQTIDYHSGIINANQFNNRVVSTFGDPSGAQWISEFAQRGIYITPANKEVGTNFNSWVRFGIEKVSEKLKQIPGHQVPSLPRILDGGLPSLFIFSSCTNTLREFETYRWKEKSVTQAQDLNEPDVPEKANDHCMIGSTLIDTPNGQIPIKDLVHTTGYVYSLYGRPLKYKNVHKTGRKQKVYKINFANGKSVTATDGHPFLLQDDRFVPTIMLKRGDCVRSLDMIQLDTNESKSNKQNNAGVLGSKILSLRFLLSKKWKEATSDRLELPSGWPSALALAYSSQGSQSFKQSNREFDFTPSWGTLKLSCTEFIPTAETEPQEKHTCKCSTKGRRVAQITSSKKLAFKSYERPMEGLGTHEASLSGMWKRIRYTISQKIQVLSSELQSSGFTVTSVSSAGYADVYNLDVDSPLHCYSVNGGIIVHNSMDALRYFAVSYKKKDPDYIIPKNDLSNKDWSLG